METIQNKKFIQEYEISPFTVLIKPKGQSYSMVYDLDEEYIASATPLDIVKKGCDYFGSSFKGSKVMGVQKRIKLT
ncbi:competence protein ComK [Bacillus sp. FSL K6-3431]|uniref:competence protein ComK n=1 Tax=Bacillus sp. FSL K6-3431 TaxID=2921500 RepID=UPI0030FC7661